MELIEPTFMETRPVHFAFASQKGGVGKSTFTILTAS